MKFKLKNGHIELIKLLKVTGFCSTGGMAKVVTEEGLVKVDGEIEYRKRRKIKKGQKVEFDGNMVLVE